MRGAGLIATGMGLVAAGMAVAAKPRQLTHVAQDHVLTNLNVWSPDARWIVYDTRRGDAFDGDRIERVEVATGRVEVLYTSRDGAHCGVVTHSPTDERIVFIQGPEHPDANWSYGFTRRRGMVVDTARPGIGHPLDANVYAPPFVPGALRGGSHVHMFSPDGQWVSFTYEDEVLARLDADPAAPPHEPNQRNIGVAVPAGPVRVSHTHPRSHDGDCFSVLVTRTVAEPRPGSDEISKAFEEGWIGRGGYRRTDGSWQHRALAFQGLVTATDGGRHAEVFVVDLPEDLTVAGASPLEGTPTTRPAPPAGVVQRRLTFTDDRPFPGVAAAPRHWLRVSPDGDAIAFLMADEAGVAQLWTVSPRGGPPRQVTHGAHGVASAFSWNPDGGRVAHVMDGSICETVVASGETLRLTAPGTIAPSPLACVYSPQGDKIAWQAQVDGYAQIFVVDVAARGTGQGTN